MDAKAAALIQNDRASEHERALQQLQQLDHTPAADVDSTEIFKNLDELRRMQIDLALEHLALERASAEGLSPMDMEQDEDSSRRYKRNAERFTKKEADVNNLMLRLEALSEAMRNFHDSMDEIRSHQKLPTSPTKQAGNVQERSTKDGGARPSTPAEVKA